LKNTYSSPAFIILTVVLVTSVSLNILFFNKTTQYYRLLNEIQLDPLGHSFYTQEVNKPVPDTYQLKQVVFFGDSRAYEWITPSTINKYRFINRGIPGQTTAQVAKRFDVHIRPLQPEIVVLQAGINDLKLIAFFPDRKNSIIANCKKNMKY